MVDNLVIAETCAAMDRAIDAGQSKLTTDEIWDAVECIALVEGCEATPEEFRRLDALLIKAGSSYDTARRHGEKRAKSRRQASQRRAMFG